MSVRLRTITGCLVCTLALVAGVQGSTIRRSAYATGDKRATLDMDETPSATPAAPVVPVKAPAAKVVVPAPAVVAAQPVAAPVPASASGNSSIEVPVDQVHGVFGIGQWLSDAAHRVGRDAVAVVTFMTTWSCRSGNFVAAARRDPYLPEVGVNPIRFGAGVSQFDRSGSIGLASYEYMLAQRKARLQAEKEAQDKANGIVAAPAPVPAPVVHMPEVQHTADVSIEASSKNIDSQPAPEQQPVAQVTPINPDVLLRFFDNQKDAQKNKDNRANVSVGVPFVMPYQSEPPLVMDSRAKYEQTKDDTGKSDAGKSDSAK